MILLQIKAFSIGKIYISLNNISNIAVLERFQADYCLQDFFCFIAVSKFKFLHVSSLCMEATSQTYVHYVDIRFWVLLQLANYCVFIFKSFAFIPMEYLHAQVRLYAKWKLSLASWPSSGPGMFARNAWNT